MKSHPTTMLRAALAAVLCLVLATAAAAQDPYAKWKFDDINFSPPVPERFALDNGLVVYFLPDNQIPVVTMSVIVRAGEVYAPAEKAGLAQITGEGLVTGGTKSRTPDQIDEQIESLGIQWGGTIGMESGSFSMNCLAKDFPTAVGLLSDLLMSPRFDSGRVQLAVDNALEDLRRQNDSPGRIARREFARLVYGAHPYGRVPTEASLGGITRADVEEFYRGYFHPDATILAVSGDLESSKLKSALKKAFGSWAKGGVTPPAIPDPVAPPPGVFQIAKDVSQTNIRIGHLGIDRHSPDRHAVRVLNHILGGGGFTSRMTGTVRSDSGLAYSVGTAFSEPDKSGVFVAVCQTKTETTAKAIGLMKWVVENLRANGIREDELAVAKDAILNSDVFNYDEPVKIVETYAWQEYNGFPMDQLKQDVDAVRAVTKADVDAAAQKYLHPDSYTILAVGKTTEFDAPLSKFGSLKTIELEQNP